MMRIVPLRYKPFLTHFLKSSQNWVMALLFFLLMVPIGILLAANNSYYLDQTRQEITIDPRTHTASSAVKITSNSNAPIKISVTPKLWTLDKDGNVVFIAPPESGYNLLQNLLFNPKEFTLMPGDTQTVRFMVRVPTDPKDAEYPFQLIFEPSDLPSTAPAGNAGGNAIRQTFDVIPVFSTTVYAYQGQPLPNVTIQDFTCSVTPPKTLTVHFNLNNTGLKHARYFGSLIVNQKSPTGSYEPVSLAKLHGGNLILVFPNTPRTLNESLDIRTEKLPALTPGNYQVDLQLADERKTQPALHAQCLLSLP